MRTPRATPASLALLLPACVLIACASLAPLLHAAHRALTASPSPASSTAPSTAVLPPVAPLLASSLAWALAIALLATLIAILPAWLLRRARSPLVALLPLPLLVPTYLAYAGFSILRAPRTPIGDWLIRLATTDYPNAPTIAAQLTALIGLALCLWPIPALLIGLRLQRLGDDTLDALALDVPHRTRRALTLARTLLPAAATSAAAVTLLCLGSAVPLHLAQADTLALRVWLALAQLPPDQHPRAWLAAWPLVAIAIPAAIVIALRTTAPRTETDALVSLERPAPALAASATLLLLALSILLPLGLFASVLAGPRDLATFWTISGPAVTDALLTAALTAPVGVLIAAAFAHAADLGARRATTLALALLLTTGLAPGVLVGSALASLASPFPAIADTRAILVLAAVARFAWVPALLGLWIARAEPPARRDLARADGIRSPLTRLRTLTPAHRAALLLAGLVLALLQLHEIEAAVILTPPGTRSLARQFLDELHFLRLDALAAGVVQIVGAGVVVAAAAGLALWALAWPPKARST